MVSETRREEVIAVTEAAGDPAAAAGPREPGWEGFSSATRTWFLDTFPTGPTLSLDHKSRRQLYSV